ncbi:MAG: PRTRC system protein C [Chloroflexota bacterium]
MSQDNSTTASVRRVFRYGAHVFDDPGREYTVEHVKDHLSMYFPELAHATTEEKTLPDGTVEVTFRKQVARKGSGYEADSRLALLLSELEAVPSYEDPLAELTTTLGREPLTLAAILEDHDTLQAHANQVFGLAGRTAQVVKRCLDLHPSPTRGVPLGF